MINNLLYCDDLAIFSESLQELQTGLDALHEFCLEYKLVINIGKTKLVTVGPKGNSSQGQKLILQNQAVESVGSWKYLGFYMNNKGNVETHIAEVYKRCSYPVHFIRKLAGHAAIKFTQLLQISAALVESLALYASEAWGAFTSWSHAGWDRNLIERINFNICKAILQVGRNTDNNGARTEIGKYPLLFSIEKRMLKYWHSIGKRQGSIVEKLVNDETFRNIGISKKMSMRFHNSAEINY